MRNEIFVTGIGTDVGKTVVSAIICKALNADYWKPIQAGDLDNSDTHKLKRFLGDWEGEFFSNSYSLTQPMSPHAAAERDEVQIDINKIEVPTSEKDLVIEGAGGILVPINDSQTIADLIQPNQKVILVSRHYLGSINHTLLSVAYLEQRGIALSGIVFVGDENRDTESIISKQSGVPVIGRIDWAQEVTSDFISAQADKIRVELKKTING